MDHISDSWTDYWCGLREHDVICELLRIYIILPCKVTLTTLTPIQNPLIIQNAARGDLSKSHRFKYTIVQIGLLLGFFSFFFFKSCISVNSMWMIWVRNCRLTLRCSSPDIHFSTPFQNKAIPAHFWGSARHQTKSERLSFHVMEVYSPSFEI